MKRAFSKAYKMAIHQQRKTAAQNKPMAELNITPLIDVLLVLLVMLMLSIPLATHKVEIDITPPGVGSNAPPEVNRLRLDAAGTTFWNDAKMDSDRLKSRLEIMARSPQNSVLHFKADAAARYERFDQVVALIKRSGVESVGFADNSQYAQWDKAK